MQIPGEDGGGGDGGPGDATVDPRDSGSDAVADALGPTACEALLKQIDTGREVLTKCCAACSATQCNAVTDDLCCSASYTNQGANPDVARRFTDLVREYKRLCNPPPCPPVACPTKPSLACDPQSGHCRAF